MDKKKKRLYIYAALLLLLIIALIITVIYSIRHRAEPEETAEPTQEIPQTGARPSPPAAITPPLITPPEAPDISGPDMPAITPPAITAVHPSSGSDIVLVTAIPSTNSDINAPSPGGSGGSNGQ